MSVLVPLAVAVPAIGGAAVVAGGALLPSWVSKLVAIATAATVTVLTSILLVGTYERPIEYAFGGWHPRRGVVIGIVFSVEPVAAASATVAALLTTASLVYSWRYFE